MAGGNRRLPGEGRRSLGPYRREGFRKFSCDLVTLEAVKSFGRGRPRISRWQEAATDGLRLLTGCKRLWVSSSTKGWGASCPTLVPRNARL